MNYKEFIQKYEELLNSGYCECNELNCLDNNPPKKILNIMKEQQQEIERLNKLISQREKKWGKWTTEKTILSTKMSDYLCKYQNLKREYTKQIKISTERKGELERLIKRLEESQLAFLQVDKEIERLNNIINELEEYICAIEYDERHSDSWQIPVRIHNKLKELKGSDSNE